MNHDRIIASLITVVGTAALLGGSYVLAAGSGSGANETRDGLPEAVQAKVDGEILEWEREDGGYELEIRTADGQVCELYVDEDGRRARYEDEDEEDDD